MERYGDFIPVPEVFWSFETGKPIDRCKLCGCNLFEAGTNYLIEKAYKNDETIFEHAICLDCHQACLSELSLESLRCMNDYFLTHLDVERRPAQCLEQYGTNHLKWISNCLIKDYPRLECREYQLYAFCIDKDMVFSGAPYMICGDAIEEIIELLSAETIKALDSLSERLFGVDLPRGILLL